MANKFCRQCGAELHEQQAICVKCGVAVGKGNGHCYYCGNAVSEEQEFCLNCGVALKQAQPQQDKLVKQVQDAAADASYNGYSKLVIALICFFLGGFGVHNFLMGEKKKGVTKIIFCFLCGISGILALIDFVKILLDKYEINPDKSF